METRPWVQSPTQTNICYLNPLEIKKLGPMWPVVFAFRKMLWGASQTLQSMLSQQISAEVRVDYQKFWNWQSFLPIVKASKGCHIFSRHLSKLGSAPCFQRQTPRPSQVYGSTAVSNERNTQVREPTSWPHSPARPLADSCLWQLETPGRNTHRKHHCTEPPVRDKEAVV